MLFSVSDLFPDAFFLFCFFSGFVKSSFHSLETAFIGQSEFQKRIRVGAKLANSPCITIRTVSAQISRAILCAESSCWVGVCLDQSLHFFWQRNQTQPVIKVGLSIQWAGGALSIPPCSEWSEGSDTGVRFQSLRNKEMFCFAGERALLNVFCMQSMCLGVCEGETWCFMMRTCALSQHRFLLLSPICWNFYFYFSPLLKTSSKRSYPGGVNKKYLFFFLSARWERCQAIVVWFHVGTWDLKSGSFLLVWAISTGCKSCDDARGWPSNDKKQKSIA